MERLELFGSAAKGAFDPKSSDIDLIAHFRNRRQGDYAARFLAFAEAAEALLQRPVDLPTEAMISNPYFKQDVDESRTTLYVSTSIFHSAPRAGVSVDRKEAYRGIRYCPEAIFSSNGQGELASALPDRRVHDSHPRYPARSIRHSRGEIGLAFFYR